MTIIIIDFSRIKYYDIIVKINIRYFNGLLCNKGEEMNIKDKTVKTQKSITVMQFGEGNFLRAFVDYMIDIANEKGAFDGSITFTGY